MSPLELGVCSWCLGTDDVAEMFEIARGRWGPEQIDVILSTRDRGYAGPTALPGGLCLMSVDYPPPAAGG